MTHVIGSSIRKGELLLCLPDNPQGFGGERVLVPCGPGEFECTGGLLLLGKIAFDTIVDGQAMRTTLCGGHYYRFFTP